MDFNLVADTNNNVYKKDDGTELFIQNNGTFLVITLNDTIYYLYKYSESVLLPAGTYTFKNFYGDNQDVNISASGSDPDPESQT